MNIGCTLKVLNTVRYLCNLIHFTLIVLLTKTVLRGEHVHIHSTCIRLAEPCFSAAEAKMRQFAKFSE